MKHIPWITLFPPPEAAPYLRKKFVLSRVPERALCRVSGVGFYELFLNGGRVGEARLDPTFTRYDARIGFREYEVADALRRGENICEIRLGHGWYSGTFADNWGFQFASYRSFPKAALEITAGGRTLLVTGPDWEAAEGPVLDDSPRTGETYDARLAVPEKWVPAQVVPPPGGKPFLLQAPPVTLQEACSFVTARREPDQGMCYDFGHNLTGTVELAVRGAPGSRVTLRYGERPGPDGNFSQDNLDWYLRSGDFQTDCYILRGDPAGETWMPSFSYHGFRYVKVALEGQAELLRLRARPLRSNFARTGRFECGSARFRNLLEAVERTLVANFIGFPCDCPHREKNGWTADAHLAAESMLAFYDAAENYAEYADTIFDYQRPSGELPGMVPGSGFGGHWNYGPCWEGAPILLAHDCLLYSGSDRIVRTHYPAMRRYLDYCRNMEVAGLLHLGVGEWKLPSGAAPSSAVVLDNAFYYRLLVIMAGFARRLGKARDEALFLRRAAELARRVRAFSPETVSELGVLLDLGLGGPAEAEALHTMVAAQKSRALCGIFGAKSIPRALAASGHADTAYEMFVQTEFPGWQWMLDHGATTLWENWRGDESQNHPMLGDAAAWAVRFLAGLAPLGPGWRSFRVAPNFPAGMPEFGWSRETPDGVIRCAWSRRSGSKLEVAVSVPAGHRAQWRLPTGEVRELGPGEYGALFAETAGAGKSVLQLKTQW